MKVPKPRGLLVLLLGLCVSLSVQKANAQRLHLDEGVSYDCSAGDETPRLHTIYVRVISGAMTAARFKLITSHGATLTYVGEQAYYQSVGNVLTGIDICMPSCQVSYFALMEVYYQGYGTSEPYSRIEVVAPDGHEVPEWLDCGGVSNHPFLGAEFLAINGASNCSLNGVGFSGTASTIPFCLPIPTQQRTWGSIKALYQ